MKCPKCRFVSFDYLDNCKRCGTELIDLKKKLNILSVVPRTGGIDEFLTKSEADVPETQEMIDTMDTYIQPTAEDLGKGHTTEEIDREIKGQEEMVLEGLPEIEIEDKEEVKSHVDLDFETISEKPFSMEEGLKEETAEKEEADAEIVLPESSVGDETSGGHLKLELEGQIVFPELTLEEEPDEFAEEEDAGTEIELLGISTGDEILIGVDDDEVMETARTEEDVELFPLEIESPIEELSYPEQPGEDVEVIHLDLSNIEVIEFEGKEPSSDKES